ncbi:hypothetical protein BH23ACT6_BH23ACT6_18530 [soil metagenome]
MRAHAVLGLAQQRSFRQFEHRRGVGLCTAVHRDYVLLGRYQSVHRFDCSDYTQYVVAKAGIDLPRTAEQQCQATTPVSEPRPGDLVFWGAPAWHNAIYAGDGMIYDSVKPGIPTQKRKMFSAVTSFGRVG